MYFCDLKQAVFNNENSVLYSMHLYVFVFLIINFQDGPTISFNAQATLKNFCIWQQSQNHLDDNHHSHHDTAILITR